MGVEKRSVSSTTADHSASPESTSARCSGWVDRLTTAFTMSEIVVS